MAKRPMGGDVTKRGWIDKKNLGTATRQAAQGATLGFADEAYNRLAAAYAAALSGKSKTGFSPEVMAKLSKQDQAALNGGSYSDFLKEAQGSTNQNIKTDWEEAPLISFASNVAGSIPFALSGPAQAVSNWARGSSMLGTVGKGAAAGAGYGAIAGAGSANPDPNAAMVDALRTRAVGSGWGAGLGGVLGAAGGALSRYITPDDATNFSKVGKTIAKDQTTKAQKMLAEQLGARPDLQAQLARAEAMNAASNNTGIQLTLAEKIAQSQSDPLLAQQKILGGNPQTAGAMEAMYAARSGTPNQAGSIENALLGQAQKLAPGVNNYDEAAQKLIPMAKQAEKNATKALTKEAGPLYKEAFQANQVVKSPLIDRILKSDTGKSALDLARRNMSDDMLLMSKPDKEMSEIARELGLIGKGEKIGDGFKLRTLDYVKRAFDTEYKTAERAGDYARMSQIEKLRAPFVAELDRLDVTAKAGPNSLKMDGGAYARARGVYSGQPEKLQLRARIGDVADIDPTKTEQVAQNLFKGRPASAKMASEALGPEGSKLAAASRIYDVMGQAKGDPTSYASKIAPNADSMQMLQTYAGGNQLDETLNVINQAKIGEKFRYGSPTQPLQEAAQGMQQAAGGALDLAVGNKVGLARKVIGMFGGGEDPRFYQDMLDLMTTEQGMDLVRQVASQQGTAVQKQQASKALITALQNKTTPVLGQPLRNTAVLGVIQPQKPINSPVFREDSPQAQGLPPGFVIEQQQPALPPGFIMDRRK